MYLCTMLMLLTAAEKNKVWCVVAVMVYALIMQVVPVLAMMWAHRRKKGDP